ncbi:MAG: hypothetical protein K2H56_00855 [Malacoplasma sp.]|nr:hypothetical protein [Malacoplasma sp.]
MKDSMIKKNKKNQIIIIIITSFILVLCIIGAGVAIYYAQQTNNVATQITVSNVKNFLANLKFLKI